MTQKKSCSIKLLNRSYEIKCPEGEEANLLLAVEKLNARIAENKKNTVQRDSFQTLLLAALDVSHELVCCKNQQAQQNHQVTQFIASLEQKINKMVHGDMERVSEIG